MDRLIPCLCVSLALHAAGFAVLANVAPQPSGVAGCLDGDPDKVFVCVVAEEDVTAVAPVPSPVDAPDTVEAKKAEEPVTPEPASEVLAEQVPDPQADFTIDPPEETPEPEPEPQKEEVVKEPEKEQKDSTPSTPQVASERQKRRAALGRDLRDFHSLMMAAIRQSTFFPQDAARKRHHGEVIVKFCLTLEGKLTFVEVVKTSGSSSLDEAAKEIIRKAVQKFPPVPTGLQPDDLHYTLPILFKSKRLAGTS